jgi:vacuole morphology and inheritance protein 14
LRKFAKISLIIKDLRLDLLDVERNQYLVRALYGLLMILPQSDAFLMLKQRLDCVPNYYNKVTNFSSIKTESSNDMSSDQRSNSIKIDFKQLLEHFIQVQEKHKFFKRQKRINK